MRPRDHNDSARRCPVPPKALANNVKRNPSPINHLGLSGKPGWALAERIVKDEFAFVTNNRADFLRLFGKMALHPGLIVVVPNAAPALRRALFQAALQFLGKRDLINAVIEVSMQGKSRAMRGIPVTCAVTDPVRKHLRGTMAEAQSGPS